MKTIKFDNETFANCKQISIGRKTIGYVREDQEDRWADIHGGNGHSFPVLYKSDGNIVKCAYTTPSSVMIHRWGFGVFEGEKKKWIMWRPMQGRGYYIPLWICGEDGEPQLIVKSNYDLAKKRYAWEKYIEQYPWGYCKAYFYTNENWTPLSQFENDFDEKYVGATIDIECSVYAEYYY